MISFDKYVEEAEEYLRQNYGGTSVLQQSNKCVEDELMNYMRRYFRGLPAKKIDNY